MAIFFCWTESCSNKCALLSIVLNSSIARDIVLDRQRHKRLLWLFLRRKDGGHARHVFLTMMFASLRPPLLTKMASRYGLEAKDLSHPHPGAHILPRREPQQALRLPRTGSKVSSRISRQHAAICRQPRVPARQTLTPMSPRGIPPNPHAGTTANDGKRPPQPSLPRAVNPCR